MIVPGRRQRRQRGQALVETALVLPVLLFTCLGFIEAGLLVAQDAAQARATATVAAWAAEHPGDAGWQDVAGRQLGGCQVTLDASEPGLVTVSATCHYDPRITHGLWDGLPISTSETAAVREAAPATSATPAPAPS